MIYLKADVVTDEAVVLRGQEVREYEAGVNRWVPCPDAEWDDVFPEFKRTRTVPVDVAALAEQPCPECKGKGGYGVGAWTGTWWVPCRACDGRGSLRPEVGVVVEQCRQYIGRKWYECDRGDACTFERRLRVVRYGRPTHVLERMVAVLTAEPWAADLEPGQTVLLFDELHTCDEETP
jgi:hypothetical protein